MTVDESSHVSGGVLWSGCRVINRGGRWDIYDVNRTAARGDL